MENEIWKGIFGYGNYMVSNFGRVKSLDYNHTKMPKLLKLFISKNKGYIYCTLYTNNNPTKYLVHRLVAEAFVPNPENKLTVNHIDGNTSNNFTNNLEWNTHSENHLHAIHVLKRKSARGMLGKTGEHNKLSLPVYQYSKLGMFVDKYIGQSEASRKTGIPQANIWKCIVGERKSAGGYIWRNIKTNTEESC